MEFRDQSEGRGLSMLWTGQITYYWLTGGGDHEDFWWVLSHRRTPVGHDNWQTAHHSTGSVISMWRGGPKGYSLDFGDPAELPIDLLPEFAAILMEWTL